MDKKETRKLINQLGRILKSKALDPIDKETIYKIRKKHYEQSKR